MSEWWDGLLTLEKVFVALALPFSLLTITQLILELFGLSGDHGMFDQDVDHGGGFDISGHDMGGFFGHFTFFSVRNLIYFLMMFGWTGLACSKLDAPVWLTIFVAVASGLFTTIIIGWIFYTFSRLTESGTVKIGSAIGQVGTVYITVPEKRSGTGVIQIVMQGVTQELNAMTDGEELPATKSVKVSEIISGNIALVSRINPINTE
ncbi:hypothetical protein HQ587_04165 [bacterium]|nr:hypothetical protein [bacterium]